MSNENEKYLYILMRTDLPSMGAGRAAAQASHAANAFIHKHGNTKDAKAWAASTPQGFGTAIVLGATLEQIEEATKKAHAQGFPTEQIVDPDYAITISAEIVPFLNKDLKGIKIERSEKDPTKYIIHRQEITCAYILGNKEDLAPILGDLPLYS
jgi:peptidyl-tRNA hydrolase